MNVTNEGKKYTISIPVAYGLLAVTVLTWSIGIVIARGVHQEIPPIGLSFWRWFVAATILIPFTYTVVFKNIEFIRNNLFYYWQQGFFMAGGGTLLFLAVNYTTAINVTLVNATQPILTGLVAWIVIRDKLSKYQVLGILSAMIGVSIMVTRANINTLLNLDFNIGDLIVVIATIFYACYAVNIRRMPKEIGLLPSTFIIVVMGTVSLLPLYLIEDNFIRPTIFSFKLVIVVIVLALLVSILSLVMWNTGNSRVGHNRASIFVNLFPVYSSILAIIFLGEQLFLFHIVGAVFVCAGIFLVVKE